MPSLLRTALALVVLTPTFVGLASCSDAEPSPSTNDDDTVVHGSALSLIQSFRFAPEASNLDAKREPGSLDVLWLGKDKPTAGPATLLDAEPRGRRVIEAAPGVKLTTTSMGFAIHAPSLSHKETAKPAKLTLPTRLDEGFTILDEGTKLGIDVKLVGTTSSEGKITETGLLVYENGFGQGRHVVHRPHTEGVEDYVVFEQRPEVEELRYEVHVPKKAGLRLVSNVLEVVDEGGAPRLRMAAPAVVQQDGAQVVPTVQVEGCAVDADTRLPWGRPVTAPGVEVCSVVVEWAAGAYPVAVDPAWTTTGVMKTARYYHTATLLSSGKVLVTGGQGGGAFASVEVYDPATGTWSSADNLAKARTRHTATLLPSGNVLVAGGSGASTEVYDPATGTWSSGPDMTTGRTGHTATALASGKVLVAGGDGKSGYLASAEVYDPASNTWTSAGSLATARLQHTATLLPSGNILVAGGRDESNTELVSTEVYDPDSNAWSSGGTLATGRARHTATALAGGNVLVAGGEGSNGSLASVEVYDPATGAWASRPDLTTARSRHTTTALTSGKVFVAGGRDDNSNTSLASAEVYDPATGVWTSGSDLTTARQEHTATLLPSGNVLVAGGRSTGGKTLASAEVYDPNALGETCAQDGECTSGYCGTGVCCDAPCKETSKSCLVAKTGVPSGTCAPIKNGVSCTQGAQCGSGNCVDGVCCDTPCSSTCEACLAAKTGQPDGTCAPVKTDTDPDNECSPQGDGVCQTSGLCNGNGACATKADTGCGAAPTCTGTAVRGASRCTALGTCALVPPLFVDCAPYVCSQGACVTSCATASDCAPNAQCSGGKCVGPKGDAQACGTGSDCTSGFCVAGICCDAACTGECDACSTAQTGLPDGQCGPRQCAGNFKCSSGACPSTCQNKADCAPGFNCQLGKCVQPPDAGKPCTVPGDCSTGFCVDGVCCDSKCTGQCEACDVPGKEGACIPVAKKDTPHSSAATSREACAGTGTCGGYCDGGNTLTCVYPGTAKSCGSVCAGESVVSSVCDGAGTCAEQAAKSCAPFSCDGAMGVCKTSCETSGDCSAGNVCNVVTKGCGPSGSQCVDATHVKGTNGQVETCPAGYTCSSATGTCNTKCSSSAECDTASGYKCESSECKKDAGGAAGAADSGGAGGSTTAGGAGGSTTAGDTPAEGSDEGGCGCEVPRSSRSTTWPGLAVAGLALASLRRRSRQR